MAGTPYVVDCGYGTTRQLLAAGVRLDALRYVFLTHLHSDHALEYGPLAMNAWSSGLAHPVDAYGPPGLRAMTHAFFESMRVDIETRLVDEGRGDPRRLLRPHEIGGPGIVLANPDVTVTAARVRHPAVKDAYAFRFDAKDRSVVVSGDTAYSPELVGLAKGADVLVHEILYLPGVDALVARNPGARRLREHLLAAHAAGADVGRVAAEAGVKMLVLSHLVPGDDSSITDEQWTEAVRPSFQGRILVGTDLMEVP